MSIKIGHFTIIPLTPGYIEGADYWIMDNETGEAMGISVDVIVSFIEELWHENY